MKRNLILIAGITIAVLVMMLLGNVITIGEKLGEVCNTVYVEYAFYALILILAAVFVIRPIMRVHNAPEFPVMAVDDEGNAFTPSSDPLLEAASAYVADYKLSKEPKDLSKLDGLLSNEKVFGVNLLEIGMADMVKAYYAEMSNGVGAVKATLEKYVK